jgi:hypothetical protein
MQSGNLPRRNWQARIRPHSTEIILAAALVGVGAAQVVIIVRQATIMEGQATIASIANKQNAMINRAFVYLDKMDYAFYDTAAAGERDLVVTVEWGNSGNTPTAHLTHKVGCFESGTAIADPFDFFDWSGDVVPDFWGPKTSNLAGTCNIAAATISRVNARKSHAYVCGVARYGETIDTAEEHVTEFCYEITVIDATNAAKNTGNTVGNHNCSDKDCP